MSERTLRAVYRMLFLWLGAACISVAVDYGLGVSFDAWWWGFLFWGGLGILWAAWDIKA